MALRSSQGKGGGDRPASAESPRRQSSFYFLRSTSLLVDDHQDCRSLSHLAILTPLYLMPLFFLGTKYGGCLYCVLLPLLLWAFSTLPKPITALVHLVTVPLLGLLAPEDIAHQYLSADVLTVALVLFLITVVDRWSKLVLFLAYGVCARFGLQRKRLFVGTCLCSFAFAWIFSGPLVAVTLLYFLDRIMSTIFNENMDRTTDVVWRSSRHGSVQESTSFRSLSAADQVLFDRLAHVAMSLKKLKRRKGPRRLPRSDDKVEKKAKPDTATAPTASGKDAGSQERTEALPSYPLNVASVKSADLVWAMRATEKPSFEALSNEEYRSAALPLLPDTGFAPVVTDQGGTLNAAQSCSSIQANEILKGESKQLQSKRATGALQPLPSLLHVSLQEKSERQVPPQSAVDSIPGKKSKPNQPLKFNAMFWRKWRKDQGDKIRPSKDADGVILAPPSKPRSRLFQSLSTIASRIARKSIRDAKVQQADVESVREHNAEGAPYHQSEHQEKGPQPDLSRGGTAPVDTGAGGGLTIYSEGGTGLVPGYPSFSIRDNSAHSNAPPSQNAMAAVAHIHGAGPATDKIIQPPSAPAVYATHLGAQNTLPSVDAGAGPTVSVRLDPVVSYPELSTKPDGAETETSLTSESQSNLPSEKSDSAKAFEPFQCEVKGLPHDAKRYGTANIGTAPEPSVAEPGKLCVCLTVNYPGHVPEKCPRKPSEDSASKQSDHRSPRRKRTICLPRPTDGSQADCEENRGKAWRQISAADVSAKKERLPGTKASSTLSEEKRHEMSETSAHKICSAKTNQKSAVNGKDELHCSDTSEKAEKGKEKHSPTSTKNSLNIQPRRHSPGRKSKVPISEQEESRPPTPTSKQRRHPSRKHSKSDTRPASIATAAKPTSAREDDDLKPHQLHELFEPKLQPSRSQTNQTEAPVASGLGPEYSSKDKTRGSPERGGQETELSIKVHNSSPDKHVHHKHPSAQLPVSMPATTAAPEAESKRGSTHERHHGSYEENQSDVSRKSKMVFKSRLERNVPEDKGRAAETMKTSSANGTEQKRENKRISGRDVPSKFTTVGMPRGEQAAETKHTPLRGSCRNASTLSETEKPVGTAGHAPSEKNRHSQNSADAVLLGRRSQRAASSTTAPTASEPTQTEGRSTMELKRRQSVVSFGADLFAAMKTESVPLTSMTTLHPEEAPSQPAQERSQSIVLKTSSLASVTSRRRRESSVDFGAAMFTIISPLHQLASAPPLRRSSVSSCASSGSASSLGSGSEGSGRTPITLRRFTRTRSCGLEDITSRRPSIGSQIGSQDLPVSKKKKVNSARTDVHNAFLFASSLMIVLGNICSFRSSGNKVALSGAANRAEIANQSVSRFTWVIVTLPGGLLAGFTCTVFIWIIYIRAHDPDALSPENAAVMRNAQEKAANPATRRGIECACTTYFVLFSLSYGPPLLLGTEPRMTLVVALASVILLTSSLTSGLQAAFEFIRNIWEMLPWGVLLILGATHVASELVQVHSLLVRAFNMVPLSFWEEQSVLEAQTLLAFAASILAEAMDKQALIDMMMPVVAQISEMKQIYPSYYAIPVVVGASSNVIMPSSVPMALLHDLSRVPFSKLFLLGLFSKIVVTSMVIVTVNMMQWRGLLDSDVSHK